MSKLEKLLPRKRSYDTCLHPTQDIEREEYFSDGYNQAISDCLAALEGKVARKLSKEEIQGIVDLYYPSVGSEKNNADLAAAICKAQEG